MYMCRTDCVTSLYGRNWHNIVDELMKGGGQKSREMSRKVGLDIPVLCHLIYGRLIASFCPFPGQVWAGQGLLSFLALKSWAAGKRSDLPFLFLPSGLIRSLFITLSV